MGCQLCVRCWGPDRTRQALPLRSLPFSWETREERVVHEGAPACSLVYLSSVPTIPWIPHPHPIPNPYPEQRVGAETWREGRSLSHNWRI